MITAKDILNKVKTNEGSTATITVKISDTEYRTSFVQYDSQILAATLPKHFNTQKDAERLVQGTGEIAGVYGDEVEYYRDRKLLHKADTEAKALAHAKKQRGDRSFYWDGAEWTQTK